MEEHAALAHVRTRLGCLHVESRREGGVQGIAPGAGCILEKPDLKAQVRLRVSPLAACSIPVMRLCFRTSDA